jgi:formate hydrogenlyase subunit 6/NADH:ubiquinone oxidoreductase subunit I
MANPLKLPMVGRSLKNLVSRPATRRYPVTPRPRYVGARGTLEFDVSTCNYCMLCMRRCPAAAITVSREERTWAIEQLTCIACGVCVDVCAKKSLTMSIDSRKVHTRAEVGPEGQRPGHEEWHSEAPAPVVAAPVAGPVVAAAKAEGAAG